MIWKPGSTFFHWLILICLFLLAFVSSGCTQQGSAPSGLTSGQVGGPGGCTSPESCSTYCQQHATECDQYCATNPSSCPGQMGSSGVSSSGNLGTMGAGTACNDVIIKQKMGSAMNSALMNPPSEVKGINWMTKVLPAGNPFPGYYYVIGTAFGPGVDESYWSGEGEPRIKAGELYCTFGYWDSTPKGQGAVFGTDTPQNFSTERYDLTIFCTNVTGKSQAAMTAALPTLTMSEDQAREYFYTVFKKSFVNIDGKTMSRQGNMYQIMWKDSPESHDQWEVQIGNGYINVGQGQKNYKETEYVASMRGQDPGTLWLYHGCRPCINCGPWTQETVLNRDCSSNSDCLGGLSCSGGYCVDPKIAKTSTSSATGISSTGSSGTRVTGAPGASCSSNSDCASGLTCKNGACSIPSGPN